MFIGLVISISIVLQFLSVFFALRLIKTTGFRLPWLFISISIFLMGVRRLIALYDNVFGAEAMHPDYIFELVGLVTSGLMLAGVVMMGPIFESMRRNERKLEALSVTDELTGTRNRRGLTAFTEHFMRRADRDKAGFYLLYADLDGMKAINDTSGHQEGDRALLAAADILRKTFRKSDIVARVGGDEFVVVPAGSEGDNMEKVIRRLQRNIDDFNSENGSKFKLSLSYGVSYYDPQSTCSIDELFLKADKLMYEQKKEKKYQSDANAA